MGLKTFDSENEVTHECDHFYGKMFVELGDLLQSGIEDSTKELCKFQSRLDALKSLGELEDSLILGNHDKCLQDLASMYVQDGDTTATELNHVYRAVVGEVSCETEVKNELNQLATNHAKGRKVWGWKWKKNNNKNEPSYLGASKHLTLILLIVQKFIS